MFQGCLLCKARKPGRFCNLSPPALPDLDGLITHVMWPMNNIMKMPYEVTPQAIEQNQPATCNRSACDAGHIQISVIVRSLPEIEQNAQGHKQIFRIRSLRNPRIGALG
jgi:hypothetical protein